MCSFEQYHPAGLCVYFFVAIIYSMFIDQPICGFLQLLASFLCCSILKKKRIWNRLITALIVWLVISVGNGLCNPRGHYVLFYYFNHRRFTVESLLYGMLTANILITSVLWFSCFSAVLTSEKISYITGGVFPVCTMIFDMVLHLIPNYQRKFSEIESARYCIGKVPDESRRKERFYSATEIISAMVSYSLESGMVTADSMKSRGFGNGKRSSYLTFTWGLRDSIVLGITILSVILIIDIKLHGGMGIEYFPQLKWQWNKQTIAGIFAYGVFCFLPSMIMWTEEIRWNRFK